MILSWTLLDLAGAVALLLWGVRMVQTGIQRAFGAQLRTILGTALQSRWRAFLTGIGVTAILQSSTATGLMVTGFLAGGLVDLVPGLAVMLGANVGTTLIVQVLSFNVSAISPVLILVGFLMFSKATAGARDFGRVLIGLGLLLLALHQFIDLLEPYEDQPSLRLILGAVSTQPILDVILAAGLTWAAHSSVAIVLVVMSFAAKGTVPPEAAFALVLGANLGTAINPVLEGASGNDQTARRLPLGNLVNRVLGVVVALALLDPIGRLMVRIEPDNARAVADFHTGFNVILAAILFPFLKPYAVMLRRWLPARIDQSDPGRAIYLDPNAVGTPVVALGAAAREALRLADILGAMLEALNDAFQRADRRQIAEAKLLDDVLDRLNSAIKAYLTAIDPAAFSDSDHRRLEQILTFAMHMEQAGDLLEKNLLGLLTKMQKRGLAFSGEGREELLDMVDRVTANTRLAASLFMTGDERAAHVLAEQKEAFRSIESEATAAHFDRLRSGQVEAAETSAMHLDAIRDLKQINAHLVAAAAYPVLKQGGKLLASRLAARE